MMVAVNGIDLYVEQRGTGKPTLVFLHYWGGSSRTWAHVVDRLAPDFQTIAIDQRGWGRSSAPDSGYALADLAADVEAFIATLGVDSYILVGHSMGGKVAQLLAARGLPGLIGLALIAPAPPTPMALPLEVRQGMVHAYDTRESILDTVAQVLAPDGLSATDLETVVADSLAGAAPARNAWPLSTSQEDISALVPAIDIPVLVISGQHDRVDPPEVLRRELLARLPNAQMQELVGVGHLSPLEAPERVADRLRTFARSIFHDGTRESVVLL